MSEFLPFGLVDFQTVAEFGKFVAVFRLVDVERRGAEYGNIGLIKTHRQIVRNLTAGANNHAARLFEVVDVEDALV